MAKENNDNYSVYVHMVPNGKVYVGITKQDVRQRWKNGEGYKTHKEFYDAITEYGWENIGHVILEDGLTAKEAEEKEKYYIKAYESFRFYGYNKTKGGFGLTDHKISSAQREKTRASLKKYYAEHPEAVERARAQQSGKKLSEETKAKIRKSEISSKAMKKSSASGKPVAIPLLKILFPCAATAAQITGVNRNHIYEVCCGKRKTAGGFVWSFSSFERTDELRGKATVKDSDGDEWLVVSV